MKTIITISTILFSFFALQTYAAGGTDIWRLSPSTIDTFGGANPTPQRSIKSMMAEDMYQGNLTRLERVIKNMPLCVLASPDYPSVGWIPFDKRLREYNGSPFRNAYSDRAMCEYTERQITLMESKAILGG